MPTSRERSPLRVALVTDSHEPSGVGEHLLTLAEGLSRDHDVVVAARAKTGLPERALALGVSGERIDPDDPVALERWFARGRFTHVHLHAGIGWEGHGLARAAHRAGIPHLLRTEHLPYLLTDPSQRAEYSDAVALVDRVICVSHVSAISYRREATHPDKVVTILNGVNEPSPRLPPGMVRAGLDVGSAPVALMVARFTEQKGHAVMLEAWSQVVRRTPGAVLLLAGAGPTLMPTARDVSRRGLAASVRLLGQRGDVPDLMAAADVLALPSRFEGLPLVILEAMASGLPVVATDAPGNREAVDHGRTGWLTPVGDADAFADALTRVIADANLRQSAARAGRRRFEDRFHADRMIAQTAQVYAAVAAARRPRAAMIGESA